MNCLEFRQYRLSDPYSHNPNADAHRDECDGCLQFERGITDLDSTVHEALSVAVPEGFAARVLLNHTLQPTSRQPTRRIWLSMTVSFFAVGLIVYQYLQPAPLEGALLAHVDHQPHEFYGSEHHAISNQQLQRVLTTADAESDLENVVYAAICRIDGEEAAHLVIKNEDAQYTVMLIPDYSPRSNFEIDTELWRGFVSPHPAGALAVLAYASDTDAISRFESAHDKFQKSLYLSAQR